MEGYGDQVTAWIVCVAWLLGVALVAAPLGFLARRRLNVEAFAAWAGIVAFLPLLWYANALLFVSLMRFAGVIE